MAALRGTYTAMQADTVRKEIANITRQLVERYRAEKVILFGSAVGGKFDDDSDLDFLIIKKDIPQYGKDRLLELDRLIRYTLPTDLLVYRPDEVEALQRMGDPFIRMILAEGKVLHG